MPLKKKKKKATLRKKSNGVLKKNSKFAQIQDAIEAGNIPKVSVLHIFIALPVKNFFFFSFLL